MFIKQILFNYMNNLLYILISSKIINILGMTEIVNNQPLKIDIDKYLKLYVFGSCQSDQYYHPDGYSQSKKPICLSDIPEFQIENEDQNAKEEEKTIKIQNMLFKASINKIACGALHTIISTTEGKVFTFGCNDQGALGRGGIEKIPTQVKLDQVIDLISAGDNHSLFASSGAGVVYFTGNYKYLRGEKMAEPIRIPIAFDINDITFRNNPESKLTKVVSGNNHSAILIGGKVYMRGQPETGTTGRKMTPRHVLQNCLTFQSVGLHNVVDIWCGGYHTIAKVIERSRFTYYGWGLSEHGQLGVNSHQKYTARVQIQKFRGMDIVTVAGGTSFSIFLNSSGQIFGCGQNDEGQLGLGQDYQYVDSQDEEQAERRLEQQIKQKMSLKQSANQQSEEKNGGNILPINSESKHQNEIKQESPVHKILNESKYYIKSIRPIPTPSKIEHIAAGSQFVYGWNDKQIYSWGFGMNYVLLNGNQENQCQPFKVKSKITNQHTIYQLVAGSQHVVYLSYPPQQVKLTVELSESAKNISRQSRKKLKRRKRGPQKQ